MGVLLPGGGTGIRWQDGTEQRLAAIGAARRCFSQDVEEIDAILLEKSHLCHVWMSINQSSF